VRRDEDGRLVVLDNGNPPSRCGDPAGESPVSVSGNAPSSRATTRPERDVGEAGRQKPVKQGNLLSGERVRGPQHEVKSAASSHLQSESTGCEPVGRAAHFTAKATSMMRDSERIGDLGGVRDAARVQGSPRNTREPSAQPQSRHGGSYKPKAKSSAAQRQSEESIVPTMIATNNAVGGKGLWGLCRIDREGTCKGMVATRPNFPGGRSSDENVRCPPRRLRGEANQLQARKIAALLDQASRRDVLEVARELAAGDCVMPHHVHKRPPVSRVREIRTHGLKGGLAGTRREAGEG
jgi:hypothetical protein